MHTLTYNTNSTYSRVCMQKALLTQTLYAFLSNASTHDHFDKVTGTIVQKFNITVYLFPSLSQSAFDVQFMKE